MSKKGSPAPVRMEAVEARQLLSAVVEHGVLNIQGTRRGDDILITLASPRTLQVVMNGEVSTFARRSIGTIKIAGNDGDDYIGFGLEVTGPARISGGNGNDHIGGTAGNDTINGDDGADRLSGNGGRDLIHGNAGNDYLWGDEGDDQLSGDSGADNLSGGDGDDTLLGGRGGDTLYEDAGRDRLCGNADQDTFYFTDSPKDVRDETRDETITPPPPGSMSATPLFDPAHPIDLVGVIHNGASGLHLSNPSSGIISTVGGSQGVIGGISGITIHGGTIDMGGGIIGGGGHTPTPPIVVPQAPPVAITFGDLTYVFRDVPSGKTLFPTFPGGVMVTSQPSLLERLRAISVDGDGRVADGATLNVPADTTVSFASDGGEQVVAAGSTVTLVGPLTLTLPSGNSLEFGAAWTLTLRALESSV